MIKCSACGKENEDGRAFCLECLNPLTPEAAAEAAKSKPGTDSVLPRLLGGTVPAPSSAAPSASSSGASSASPSDTAAVLPPAKLRMVGPSEPIKPQADSQPAGNGAGGEPPKEPPPRGPQGGQPNPDPMHPRGHDIASALAEIRERANSKRRPRIIALFGHSKSGKSAFLSRTKSIKEDLGYVEVSPALNAENFVLAGTLGLHLHVFRRTQDDVLAIIDIEGEMFSNAFEDRGIKGGSGATDRLMAFVEVLACADGYMFLAPATETLYLEPALRANLQLGGWSAAEVRQRTSDMVRSFRLVAAIAGHLGRKAQNDEELSARVAAFLDLPPSKLNEILDEDVKTDRPAILLLSKADVLERLCELDRQMKDRDFRDFYDYDPWTQIALSSNRGIIFILERHFRRFKIDFVSAAYGHEQYDDKGKINENIDLATSKYFGVREAIAWLRDAIDAKRRLPSFMSAGVKPAMLIRWVLDPGFRRIFSRREHIT